MGWCLDPGAGEWRDGVVIPAADGPVATGDVGSVDADGWLTVVDRRKLIIEAIRQTLDLNLIAPFRLAQEIFPHMRAAGRGSVVNVSSISGHVGVPGIPQASYAASKLGLSGLTAELAVQWARHGIGVNTVAPGFFRSEITDSLYTEERSLTWLRP